MYAKCDVGERLQLWNEIYSLSSYMNMPWKKGGDFNDILHKDENIGGLPIHPQEYEDFACLWILVDCLTSSFKEAHSIGII